MLICKHKTNTNINGVVHLVAKIPDNMPGGKAVAAKIAPKEPDWRMQM